MNILAHLRSESNNELYIDSERMIAVNARNMSPAQIYRYYKNQFVTMRPDLTEIEYQTFIKRYMTGEQFLNQMRKFITFESGKVSFLYPHASRYDKVLNMSDQFYQLNTPFILGARAHANRGWEDVTKIVAYFEKNLHKIVKYGLDYPQMYAPRTQEELQKREDEIFERLVKEMRKPPVQVE